MKNFVRITAMVLALGAPVLAQPVPATPAAPAAATGKTFSVDKSTVGELLENPAARAVFAKNLPDLIVNPQLDQGRDMTLPEIVQYVPELTPDKLATIDAQLKALPPQ
jgi:hypothetical protein